MFEPQAVILPSRTGLSYPYAPCDCRTSGLVRTMW
jgi:hypothetical protein